MSKLVPFNKETQIRQTPFSNMLEDFFTEPWYSFRLSELDAFKLDVKEDEKQYTIEAEAPGARKEDITLSLENGRLTISVAGKEDVKDDKKKTVHKERRYTYMERSIYLADAKETGAKAKLENGELVITVPKRSTGAPDSHKIEIR